ncbi:hypothetical protein CKAH01_08312 [Colletotrichum kahawae]|uniref:Uncharacterized protein n=1 Tax=Colletotrichum kahawae TaxID=34407 RepID=A0AAE0D065_COLKA|nr:hypothetical protein CKAH01_08312 [Colletotrichum kahawae]
MAGVSLQVKACGRGLVMSTGGWLARWKGGCETGTQEREQREEGVEKREVVKAAEDGGKEVLKKVEDENKTDDEHEQEE